MDTVYFNRVRRILACNTDEITPDQAAELTALIDEKVKPNDAKATTEPNSEERGSGAAA